MRIDHVHVTDGGQAVIGNVLPHATNQTITATEATTTDEPPEILDVAQSNGQPEE